MTASSSKYASLMLELVLVKVLVLVIIGWQRGTRWTHPWQVPLQPYCYDHSLTCMEVPSPTRSVEIGIGKSIGRGDGKGIGIGNTWMAKRFAGGGLIHGNCYYHSTTCMAATSPTRSVEIGVGKSIGRGAGKGIGAGVPFIEK